MKIATEKIGCFPEASAQPNKDIYSYTVENENGTSITLWSYGASMIKVLVRDKNGKKENVIQSFDTLDDYLDDKHTCYMGSTMGRFARCIEKGKFKIEGKEYQLDCNENGHHFHGGRFGFDKYNWKGSIEKNKNYISVIFSLQSSDGDQGYPGVAEVKAIFELHENDRFVIKYEGMASKDTLMGLTNHSFWNLSGQESINSQMLKINSGRYIPANEEFIPIDSPANLHGTVYDFQKPRIIGETKLDLCYILDDGVVNDIAELSDPLSGRKMKIKTNQKALAVYTGDYLEKKRSGIALQTGPLPNAPNYSKESPSILKKGEKYIHYFIADFSVQ